MANNLLFHQVTITPEMLDKIANLVFKDEKTRDENDVYTWVAYVRQSLYKTWSELPDGDHLKGAYIDDVWSWDDQDLARTNTGRPKGLDD